MNKSILILSAAALFTLSAKAQTSYGIKAGVNLAHFSNADAEAKDYQSNNLLYYVTGFADIPIANQFSIQPGVSLQTKGDKYNFDINNAKGSASVNIMSIEVPVNFVYYIPAGSGDFFLGAGPYVGFNISGKAKATGDVHIADPNGNELKSKDLKFSGDQRDVNRIDAGANFLLGYKLSNGLLINAGYGLGLAKLNPEGSGTTSNRVFNFGIGVQF